MSVLMMSSCWVTIPGVCFLCGGEEKKKKKKTPKVGRAVCVCRCSSNHWEVRLRRGTRCVTSHGERHSHQSRIIASCCRKNASYCLLSMPSRRLKDLSGSDVLNAAQVRIYALCHIFDSNIKYANSTAVGD